MRKILKWTARIFLVLVLSAVAIGLWKREELRRLMHVKTLFDADRIVENFSHMDHLFLSTPIQRGDAPVSKLRKRDNTPLPKEVSDWIDARNVTSLLVLKDGDIVHESYYHGTGPADLRISWSVAKSYLSILTGILLERGDIRSLDDPVIDYVPALRDSAYHHTTLRQVLNMTSGVVFDEDYLEFHSDINRMGRVLAMGGRMDEFAAGLTETFIEPGKDWKYVSIDTHVIGMVLRGATGRSVPDLMGEYVIRPLGLEKSPYYLTDGQSVAFVLGGLNMTTRDYARFGQMILQGGTWQGQQIVSRDWITQSTTATAPTDADEFGYGYQWWIPLAARPREYLARGVYGQYIYFNEPAGVVIVSTAADRRFRETGVSIQNVDLFRQIVDYL